MNQKKILTLFRKIRFVYEPLASLKNYLVEGKMYKELQKIYYELYNKEIFFLYCEPPDVKKIEKLSEFERERIQNWVFDFNQIRVNSSQLQKMYKKIVSEEYLMQLFDGIKIVPWGQGKRVANFQSQYVNIVNGIRITTNQPHFYYKKIHVFGACTARGTGVEDGQTIESYLQKLVNEVDENEYMVVNHGIGCGSTISDDLVSIADTIFKSGDIVILLHQSNNTFINMCKKNGIPYLETSQYFNDFERTKGEWFLDDPLHTTAVGNEFLAKIIFNRLKKDKYLRKENYNKKTKILKMKDISIETEELDNYIEELKKIKKSKSNNFVNGGIVMNCNPFTCGHRYLIEAASKEVQNLYVFVVEENKSFFDFKDRFNLVRTGVKDLENVIVVPSGKFILSAVTFPGYFNKEYNNNAVIDASMDIDIFGKYIAKVLDISVRFVGEEPIDKVTEQYNETMKERLPLYDIKFKVISRKLTNDGLIISASTVRQFLKEKKFSEIKKMVPKTTYDYLIETYGEIDK